MARASTARPLRMVALAALALGALAVLCMGSAFVSGAPGSAGSRGASAGRTARGSLETDIDARIDGSKVFMVSKEACPFCLKAKRTFKNLGVEVDVLELVDTSQKPLVDDPDAVQDYMAQKTGARSVPRVFIGGEFVGGCDDVLAKADSGELEEKLKAAGAM
eukprot:TRINITY_DN69010_c0_g1_i1.p1 TRINITY_DN69010_c0_g1~~TRINITY_DN69010_c0_g1_i1.p1  ORF type:complete len:162 (-),score=42.99 TRINITY_DN69010_c0_g1_i1:268-753(-)